MLGLSRFLSIVSRHDRWPGRLPLPIYFVNRLHILNGITCGCRRDGRRLICLRDFHDKAMDVSGVLAGAVESGYFYLEPVKEIARLKPRFRTADTQNTSFRR
jgi:hypothetical protein